MSTANKLSAKFGAHIQESMGATVREPAGAFAPPPVHGGPGASKYQGAARVKDALAIEVDRLVPDPDQPRKEFDPAALDDLAASLKARGQLQPIRVRWDDVMERWVIIAGERRYRAAARAGLPTLLCVEARGPLTPDDILEDQLVENCLREDLRPVEQGRAFRALLDRRGCSIRQLAETLHVSHQQVIRALALLDLPANVRDQVEQGTLAPSVAYEVSRLADTDAQAEVAARVVAEGLSRDEAIEAVRRKAGAAAGRSTAKRVGKAKGRGGPVRFRTAAGLVVTVARARGSRPLDPAEVASALRDAVGQNEGRAGEPAEAA